MPIGPPPAPHRKSVRLEEVVADAVAVALDVVADVGAGRVAHPAGAGGEVELRPWLERVLADPAVALDVLAGLADGVVRPAAAPRVHVAGVDEGGPRLHGLRLPDNRHR